MSPQKPKPGPENAPRAEGGDAGGRESERLFQAMFQQAAVGMAQVDLSGRWIRVNQKLCDIVGYSRKEMGRLSFQDITHPEDLENDLRHLRRLMAGEIPTYNIEKRYIRKDGRPIWVNLTVGLERDPGTGKPEWFVSIIEDITVRKAAEAALLEKEAFLQSIYQGVEEAIFVLDVGPGDEFTFAGFNPAYLRLGRGFGVDMSEVEGKTTEALLRFFPEAAVANLRSKYRQCAESGQAMEYEESVPIDGKPTYWLTHLAPLSGADGKIYRIIGTGVNVTSRKESIEKIRTTEENLRQAQKMEAVGRLAGGIAHDFNNLLTAINGYGDILLARTSPAQQDYAFIREIRNAGERAASLTQQLLAFSRKQVLLAKEVDLNATVADMGALLKRLIGEDIALEIRLAEGLEPIFADPGQIEQVILNLALNSRDAMPNGGRLTLATSRVEAEEPALGMGKPLKPGNYALLTVSDNGKGMDAETRSRIFEPFFTTKRAGQGTGLGLSTVYGIVTQTGGDIQASSEPGQGAVFKVYLPMSKSGRKAVREAPKAESAGRPGGHETVLVVEDEEAVRKLITEVLAGAGYAVVPAENGVAALRAAETHAGRIDLLLTDLVMGEMGGRELAEKIQARMPWIRLIYMSGYTDDTAVRHGILEARTEFLQKPFSAASLLQRVRGVLDGKPLRP
ncbi:MAG TPA: PAS domain S-box protein [Fibrobacteria bacterium]|nr:PAS domain S-box protein [Fibrobacteria bacterium]